MSAAVAMTAPPRASWAGWARANLFASPASGLVTVALAGLIAAVVWSVAGWALIEADWRGATRADCRGEGACWVFIAARLDQFVYGFYPEAERWRVDLAGLGLALSVVPWFASRLPHRLVLGAAGLVVVLLLAPVLLGGGVAGLAVVETRQWGGMMLTIVVTVYGLAAAFPLGVLLALGRRSRLPVVRVACIGFIELWRGVPLITVLFMASVMLPLFLPQGVEIDKLVRALIGVSLFAAAYMAEVVRGGLQAIPRGQLEAAAALGLGPWRVMALVVLPQALRHVVPGIANTFIALFKDTTLVLVIGLFDFLGVIQAALTDPEWLGYALEGYVFAAAVYWVICFSMSRLSRRFEHSGAAS